MFNTFQIITENEITQTDDAAELFRRIHRIADLKAADRATDWALTAVHGDFYEDESGLFKLLCL